MHAQEDNSCGASPRNAGANYRVITADGTPIDLGRLCMACDNETTASEAYLIVFNPDTDTESENEAEFA
eukprot:12124583-Prorocentrum_lima.AAC.1